MQDSTNEDIMVQGVTDEEKTFDSNEFGLDKRILKAVSGMGYTHPTLVQAQVIPLVLAGKDVLVKARTGSGKTVAYAIPAIQKLLSLASSTSGIKVVVLVPSKELCIQTYNCFKALTRYCSNEVNCVALYDMNIEQQKGYLNEFTDVVISTPKILLSHLKYQTDNVLKNINTFIVDEADILLSFGYENDVSKIIELIPATCQNMVLSATLTDDVTVLKQKLLHNCVTIKLKEENSNLNEYYIDVNDEKKPLLLYALLRLHVLKGKVIIFVNSLELGYYLYIFLTRFSMKAIVLNNELPALSRNNIIYQFNRGMFDYLIATDEGLIQSKDDEEKKDKEEDDALLGGDDDDVEEEGASLSGESDDNADNKEEGASLSGESDGDLLDDNDDEEEAMFDMSDEEGPAFEEQHSEEDEVLDNNHYADEFNASRGIDFENVSAVVNYSMPTSVSNYVHRIGRTARAQNVGTALSFVDMKNEQNTKILVEIQKYNPPRNGKPSPQCLPFDIKEIESFTYRVEDVRRGITKNLIKETRIMELRKEMLNSNKLKMHFEDNPQELKVLQHAAAKKVIKPIAYLKDIPDYLIPDALKTKVNVKDESRKENKGEWKKRKIDDPLRSFAVTAELLDNHQALYEKRGKYQVSNNIRIPMSGHARWEERNKKALRRKRQNRKH